MMSKEKTAKKAGAGGRPPKFQEARRPITVTLPERVLQKLELLDPDRARAIVKCVEAVAGGDERLANPVELVEVLPGKGLIVIGPSRTLKTIDWLRLVEMGPGRYLLALPSGTSVESLEVEIHDLMAGLGPEEGTERDLLEKLQSLLGQCRRRKSVSKAELIFVDVA